LGPSATKKKDNMWMQGGSNLRYYNCRKNDLRRPRRVRQFFSSSRIDHVISRIKSGCATDGRGNNIREGAFYIRWEGQEGERQGSITTA